MYPTVVIFCHMLVFDASTLILMARIELLDKFLDAIPMKAVMPKEVERECCSVKKSLDALQIQRAVDQVRIKVKHFNPDLIHRPLNLQRIQALLYATAFPFDFLRHDRLHGNRVQELVEEFNPCHQNQRGRIED